MDAPDMSIADAADYLGGRRGIEVTHSVAASTLPTPQRRSLARARLPRYRVVVTQAP